MENDTHYEICVAGGWLPDYEVYGGMALWPLFDAVCLIIQECPDNQQWWSEATRNDFDEIEKSMKAQILSEGIDSKIAEGEYWVDKNDVLAWASTTGFPLHPEFEALEKSARQLQKERTANKWKGLQAAADKIYQDEYSSSRRKLGKDAIAARLQKAERWKDINSGTLQTNFDSPKRL